MSTVHRRQVREVVIHIQLQRHGEIIGGIHALAVGRVAERRDAIQSRTSILIQRDRGVGDVGGRELHAPRAERCSSRSFHEAAPSDVGADATEGVVHEPPAVQITRPHDHRPHVTHRADRSRLREWRRYRFGNVVAREPDECHIRHGDDRRTLEGPCRWSDHFSTSELEASSRRKHIELKRQVAWPCSCQLRVALGPTM
jgi:hypothetical protein